MVDEFVAGGNWYGVIAAAWLPDGRMVAAQLEGNVYLINPATGAGSAFFRIPDVYTAGEVGLLDVAVDPNFASNNYFYAYFTQTTTHRLEVSRFTLAGTGAATLASRVTIWRSPGPAVGGDYHTGGSINFGPDGKMYITTGDNLYGPYAQSLNNVFGKALSLQLNLGAGLVEVDLGGFGCDDAHLVDGAA